MPAILGGRCQTTLCEGLLVVSDALLCLPSSYVESMVTSDVTSGRSFIYELSYQDIVLRSLLWPWFAELGFDIMCFLHLDPLIFLVRASEPTKVFACMAADMAVMPRCGGRSRKCIDDNATFLLAALQCTR